MLRNMRHTRICLTLGVGEGVFCGAATRAPDAAPRDIDMVNDYVENARVRHTPATTRDRIATS